MSFFVLFLFFQLFVTGVADSGCQMKKKYENVRYNDIFFYFNKKNLFSFPPLFIMISSNHFLEQKTKKNALRVSGTRN